MSVPRPALRYHGGKWLLAPTLSKLLPKDFERSTYREPFLGGGGLFFWLASNRPPKRVYLSDALQDLITSGDMDLE